LQPNSRFESSNARRGRFAPDSQASVRRFQAHNFFLWRLFSDLAHPYRQELSFKPFGEKIPRQSSAKSGPIKNSKGMRHTAASRPPGPLAAFFCAVDCPVGRPLPLSVKTAASHPKGWRRFRIYVNRPVFLASGIADEASHGTTTSKKRALWRKISTIEDGMDEALSRLRSAREGIGPPRCDDDGRWFGAGDEIAYEI
jgi:hypothetical protein